MSESFQDSRHASLVLGLALGCVAYLVCIVFSPPVLCYLPEVQQWSFTAPPDLIAMRYYGMPQWGIGGFLIGFLLARIGPIARVLAEPAAARVLTRVTAAIVGGSLIYIAVKELSHWGSR